MDITSDLLPVGVVNTRSHMGARRQRLTPSGVVIQSVKDAGRRRRRGRGVVTTSQQERVQATRLPPPKKGSPQGKTTARTCAEARRAGARPEREATQGWWAAMLKLEIGALCLG